MLRLRAELHPRSPVHAWHSSRGRGSRCVPTARLRRLGPNERGEHSSFLRKESTSVSPALMTSSVSGTHLTGHLLQGRVARAAWTWVKLRRPPAGVGSGWLPGHKAVTECSSTGTSRSAGATGQGRSGRSRARVCRALTAALPPDLTGLPPREGIRRGFHRQTLRLTLVNTG